MSVAEVFSSIGYVLALSLSAIGSALGTCVAGLATIGAWKKCYLDDKKAPFILVAFAGAPLTQTIYGMILMNTIKGAPSTVDPTAKLAAGLAGGLAIGMSAWMQGKAAAAASDAFVETGKGFANYIMVIGITETVAVFVMVFLMAVLR